MKKLYKTLMAGIFTVALPLISIAQVDIHFSQFYETSILRNPALTGVFADDYKIGIVYRNQWSSVANPYQTAVASAETRSSVGKQGNDFISFGLLTYLDKAGSIDHKIISVYPAINYNKSLEDKHNSFLSVGFSGGFTQYSFDPSKATFNNQYLNGFFNANNPTGEKFPNPKLSIWDLGSGINFNSSLGEFNNITYVVGIAGYHFSEPKTSFYNDQSIHMDMRWNLNLGVSEQINEQYSFQVQGNYAVQGDFYEAIGGALVGWNRIGQSGDPSFTLYLGMFYRYQDAVIPTVKMKYKNLYFGLSYDVNVSTLKAASNLRGGLEFSVYKTGDLRDHNANKSKVLCPNFY